ncbi:NADPH-adrenodoxin reductase [Coemansia sp. RSA 1358]|uniref:NADPH:adrenodoxin oxidoreductase, mitochondrial n=1 Tax=Coemansia umbellata TaxID=1424467 RepID=A0ABQ8PGW1_9FUNG|nr:NADPH-adrenodoxin reductase [Coemansia umbellata]KAJ2619422.1 NADPH-adrenodoxin reductase [Coemansia sp. RSA 1358]
MSAIAILTPRLSSQAKALFYTTRIAPKTARCFTTSAAPKQGENVAIVGGGAAGFYTAARLLTKPGDFNVDIFEQLPTPHGLVRYGVAPDHPEVKNCMNKFDEVASNARVRFFGNVRVGSNGSLSLDSLRSLYDSVVLSYGASKDRHLGIPGENGNGGDRFGVLSARRFVAWYNGLPEAQDLKPDLFSFDKIVIVGQGNVALDCARILLTDPDELAKTDITAQALEVLRKSKIRHVEMVGRRGPLQVAFTAKELREMTKIPGVRIVSDTDFISSECTHGAAFLANSRPLKRMMDLLLKHAVPPTNISAIASAEKTFEISFLKSPTQVLFNQKWGDSGEEVPQLLRFQVNKLEGLPDAAKALPTDKFVDIPCAMALRSIGYASTPIDGAPFDSKRKIVPNIAGRVVNGDNEPVPGLYVAGWLKRGPIGVIATTMQDAYRTADAVAMDINNGNCQLRQTSRKDIDDELSKLGVDKIKVANGDWKRLEEYEFKQGKKAGKPREKVPSIGKMLSVIRSTDAH